LKKEEKEQKLDNFFFQRSWAECYDSRHQAKQTSQFQGKKTTLLEHPINTSPSVFYTTPGDQS
jgi:hypothetical protein